MRMSRKTKNLLVVIGIVLVASFLIVALGKVSSGFQDWDTDNWQLRKPNEDNLYQSLTFNLMDGSKDTIDPGTYGVTVKLNEDDNTIKVKGAARRRRSYTNSVRLMLSPHLELTAF